MTNISKDIVLLDWTLLDSNISTRWERKCVNCSYAFVRVIKFDYFNNKVCFIHCTDKLKFLHKYISKKITGDLEYSKNYIDNILLKNK